MELFRLFWSKWKFLRDEFSEIQKLISPIKRYDVSYHNFLAAGFKAVILLDQMVLQKNIWEQAYPDGVFCILHFVFYSVILLSRALLYPQMRK